MKYFKNAANQVYAFELDGSQDEFIPADLTPISDAEADAIRFPPQPPIVPTSCTSLEFLERFTEAEQLGVVTAAMTNAQVRLWYDKLIAAQEVVFTDQRVSAGLDALIAAGLLAAERKAVLLTP